MSHSLKKGSFVSTKLEKEILAINESDRELVIKIWFRASMTSPDFVRRTIVVHNGKSFISVSITENMVGHRLGEFAPTRTFRGHSGSRQLAPL